MSETGQLPQEVMEDWYALLQRPGMSVLATFLKQQERNLLSQLANRKIVDDYNKVCEVRGELDGTKKIIHFVKREFDRAAKSDTPEKETK